ncbi:PAN domain protein [Rubellimicrobium mesophilum DSM 19309]|uniref:PAN domain protein n=1 Tax=Rubellimicrobium mesophilum DSM 19309 TaxID=442562 RepID=A0A017HNB8_9RHOB|nr:alpha-2-macroglobulin family protein [Rubellimicrobium mesophilum]EYD75279.1 PAN domain protein [Rubellimicrobium mesophilum DSM 19309]
MRRLIAAGLFALASPALAQDASPDGVPDRRVAISRDVDFYGSDLSQMFDVTLDACQATCLADSSCVAFTYNTAASSCFPKGGVGEVRPFAGGISGRVLDTDAAVLADAAQRVAQLNFLQSYDFESAETLGREIGREHSSDENSSNDLIAWARDWESQGDTLLALKLTGAAIALTDDPGLWRDYARLALLVPTDTDEGSAARARALPAALAATMRGRDATEEAQGLLMLAQALEADGRGQETVPALRLAYRLDPSAEVEAALDRVVGFFGFNVSESHVDSDAAEPRACVLFNEGLRQGFDYAPFVQLPSDALTVSVDEGQLCVEGLTHGQRVTVTLREGLPSASGEALAKSIPLDFYVRDRSPAVRVLSQAYVLPKGGPAAIPVETVNLDEVALSISRVNDRNLLRSLVEGSFSAPLYEWDRDWFERNIGTPVWEGTVEVARGALNADVTTEVPLAEALAGQPAGVYMLAAGVPGENLDDRPATTQWFVLSDLGLATFQGEDGLTVAVRSLADASGVGGAQVTLLSRSNGELGVATTDADGVAQFAAGLTRGEGGAAPALVTVTTGDPEAPTDMAFLSLMDPAFDLSDRGVEGREAAGPMDAFLTTDRGAYRAGETIHATALLRDDKAQAVEGVPLTAVLTRPDGVEYARTTSTIDAAGGHVFAFDIAGNAPRGTWRLAVKADPEADEPLTETRLLVEDFLPERVDVKLTGPEGAALNGTVPVGVQADWLFGAPAADLTLEGEVTLSAAEEVEGFAGWTWGLHDAPFETRMESFGGSVTDATGAARLDVALPFVEEGATQPLEARVAVRAVESSGRPVERTLTVPVAPDRPILGLRLPTDVRESTTARIEVVGLGPDLQPVPMHVAWTVNRLETRYQWYSLDGSWSWEPQTRRVRVGSGEMDLNGPVALNVPVEWGEYEVLVERTDGDYAAASATFYAGWYAPVAAEESPDRLEVSLDAEAYRPGDTATLRIVSEGMGTALVSVLSNRVVAMQAVAVQPGETTVQLPVTDEWGTGAYVAAHLLRPVDGRATGDARSPTRALGLAYAEVDPGDRHLSVGIDAPDEVRPRGPLAVGLQVNGVAAGEQAYVTLAAVDVGILNLTGFESPDPAGHYFGQRRLGVELRDLYGRLIEPGGGAMGILREGGDAGGMGMRSPPPTEQLLAYFEGPVTVDGQGHAEVSFDLPAFNGTVRLMAVAWSPRGVGSAEDEVIVRDPVVLTASLPRVLSPGDESRLRVDLTETEGTGGTYKVEVLTSEGLQIPMTREVPLVDLAAKGTWRRDYRLTASEAGTQDVTVRITTPSGEVLDRTYTLAVAARDPLVAQTHRFTLEPSQTFTFDHTVLSGFAPGTGEASLSVGPLARLNVAGLLTSLDRVPYGCTEQVTSQAMPLLYLSDVARALEIAPAADLDKKVDDAITLVLANQDSSGAFGLWGPTSGDLWLDAYVTDFLSRARAQGHEVPDAAWESAINNLKNQVAYYGDFEQGGQDLAYALLVLAREGKALVGDLRYYADAKADQFATPLAVAQLGAALAAYGDQPRADRLFAQAGQMLDATPPDPLQSIWRADYGTQRRDQAAVLTLAAEAGSTAVNLDRLSSEVGASVNQPASTQESVWTLLAAHALSQDAGESGITVNGVAPTGPVAAHVDGNEEPLRIANTGDRDVDLTVTALGVPEVPGPAGGTGWAIDRTYYTMEGEPASPGSVAVGTRLVAVLKVTPMGFQAARLMVNDPLPGGFEIDNPDLLSGGDTGALSWLTAIQPANAEARDDRFLAAVDWESQDPFQVAYVVRAVTPGRYHHPAASVEDMYRPAMRAQGATGEVTVQP